MQDTLLQAVLHAVRTAYSSIAGSARHAAAGAVDARAAKGDSCGQAHC